MLLFHSNTTKCNWEVTDFENGLSLVKRMIMIEKNNGNKLVKHSSFLVDRRAVKDFTLDKFQASITDGTITTMAFEQIDDDKPTGLYYSYKSYDPVVGNGLNKAFDIHVLTLDATNYIVGDITGGKILSGYITHNELNAVISTEIGGTVTIKRFNQKTKKLNILEFTGETLDEREEDVDELVPHFQIKKWRPIKATNCICAINDDQATLEDFMKHTKVKHKAIYANSATSLLSKLRKNKINAITIFTIPGKDDEAYTKLINGVKTIIPVVFKMEFNPDTGNTKVKKIVIR